MIANAELTTQDSKLKDLKLIDIVTASTYLNAI